jgi:hypothetical protein
MANDRIRVLEIGMWGIGGTEQAIEARAALLPRPFFDVRAVGGGPRLERLAARGIPTFQLGRDPSALEALLREFRPHVVHYPRSERRGGYLPRVQEACRKAAIPAVVETDVFGRPPGWAQTRPPIRVCHMSLTSMWRRARQSGVTMSDLYSSGHSVIYLPVPTTTGFGMPPDTSREDLRATMGVRPTELLACRVGRPDLRKWSTRLELALPKMFEAVPSLRFALLAAPRQKVARLRRRFGDRVICLDPTSDLARIASLYAASDLMIHSSGIGESFGLSMAEAMYYGLPVIVDSTPEMDNAQVEVVEHARSGLVVESVSGFVAATRLLAQSAELRKEMGRAAHDRATALFSDVAVVAQWQRLYVDACRAAGIDVPASISDHTTAIQPVPAPTEYAGYPADYEQRCRAVLGPGDALAARTMTRLLRARDTAAYMRQIGLRNVLGVIRSRLASSGSLRRD